MTDIVERLRLRASGGPVRGQLDDEAADEIERLREALRQTETVMMIVEPRNHKAEYLAALNAIRKTSKP